MKPLVIHKGPPTSFFDAISRIHDKIKDIHNSLQSKITGDMNDLKNNSGHPSLDDG